MNTNEAQAIIADIQKMKKWMARLNKHGDNITERAVEYLRKTGVRPYHHRQERKKKVS